jgi:hypothetical protein
MAPNLDIVIFSKDRACQCDSLLRSIRDNFGSPYASLTVLYKTSSPRFQNGYDLLAVRPVLDRAVLRQEHAFYEDVAGLCNGFDDASLVMFLVDDDVVFRPCDISAAVGVFTDEHLFISLRASRSYAGDVAPRFLSDGPYLEWKWNYHTRSWVTWNYPFSVDGNIFHANHIKKIIRKIAFDAPNSFEGRMHTSRHAWWIKRIKKALALPEAAVFNNPLNRVQTESRTWHSDVSAEAMNDYYLNGMSIDNAALYAARPGATHHAVELSFVKI